MIRIKDLGGEWHIIATVDDPLLSAKQQIQELESAAQEVLNQLPASAQPVMKRWFVSDAANQEALIPHDEYAATSIVEQPPLNGSKVALWVWVMDNASPLGNGIFLRDNLTHLFKASQTMPEMDSYTASKRMLENLSRSLQYEGGSLADNCVRTWLFVRDIDNNYQGVVTGRNKAFEKAALKDHFIASTGIEGCTANPKALVDMDSYSIVGLAPGQMRYLHAREYLNPTHEYGVAFERGTYVDYGDQRHVFISGTASINNKGEIVHPGDLKMQAQRMLLNIEALLHEAGCDYSHVGHLIVYLRDIADYQLTKEIFDSRFPDIPHIIVNAPVCRPGWLIETECMATCKLNVSADPHI